MQRVAVIGAGMAGVVLARHLGHRARVEVFEKSRGPSGRLATRRVDGFTFDHGAQFFTARDSRFRLFLEPYLKAGLVDEWKPLLHTIARGKKPYKRDWFEPHYVAVPEMNALVKNLAEGLDVRTSSTIAEVRHLPEGWQLREEHGALHGPFDWVISTCPAAQTQALLPHHFTDVLSRVKLQACFSLMLGFPAPPKVSWQAAVFQDSCLSWGTWNQSKPGRAAKPALTLLSDNAWAEQHLDDSLDQVRAAMCRELAELTSIDPAEAVVSPLHRWRYANAQINAEQAFLIDPEAKLAACGDWCLANRVEAAFLSAARLANRLNQLIPWS